MNRVTREQYENLFQQYRNDILSALKWCGGFYRCPKDASNERIGPLVAYAATYKSPSGEKLHLVGDVYANFAKMEQHDYLLYLFASDLAHEIRSQLQGEDFTAFCAAPMGGIKLSAHLATHCSARGIFPEKEVIKPKSDGGKEESRLVWNRHKPQKGDRIVVVDDVVNNLSTFGKIDELVDRAGAKIVAVCSLFNRSPNRTTQIIVPSSGTGIPAPVISLCTEPVMEYRQDDEEVWNDIRDGNVVWNPKDNEQWTRLMDAMQKAQK